MFVYKNFCTCRCSVPMTLSEDLFQLLSRYLTMQELSVHTDILKLAACLLDMNRDRVHLLKFCTYLSKKMVKKPSTLRENIHEKEGCFSPFPLTQRLMVTDLSQSWVSTNIEIGAIELSRCWLCSVHYQVKLPVTSIKRPLRKQVWGSVKQRMSIYSYTFKSVILESVKIKIFSKSVKMIQIILSENL